MKKSLSTNTAFISIGFISAVIFSAFSANVIADSVLDRVKSSGVMTISYRESSIPFSYLGDNGRPVGFSWEICNKIADEVKKQVGRPDMVIASQAVTSQNRIPLLQNGTIDLECGSTTNSSERAKQVAFATNYFYTGTRFLTMANSGIKSFADLKGKKLAVTTGTTNYQVLRKLSAEQNISLELIGAKDHTDGLLMVESGRVDAFAMDDILLYGLRASSKDPKRLIVVGDPIQVEPYAIMVNKDDPQFKALVDSVIANLMKSGEFDKLYKKWFESNIPPKGINLNAPMSKELKANMKALSDKPAI